MFVPSSLARHQGPGPGTDDALARSATCSLVKIEDMLLATVGFWGGGCSTELRKTTQLAGDVVWGFHRADLARPGEHDEFGRSLHCVRLADRDKERVPRGRRAQERQYVDLGPHVALVSKLARAIGRKAPGRNARMLSTNLARRKAAKQSA
jgi:hypothetical protein